MKDKLKYKQDFDYLNNRELELLKIACSSIKHFVSKSDKINKIDHKTRDAHVTPYASLRGTFSMYDNFEERDIFPSKELDCIIRISNPHMKRVSQNRTIPAYGFSVKLSNSESTVLNLPLVNFPLFPINNVTTFLKIFTSVNYFFSGNIFQKFWRFLAIIKNFAAVSHEFFHPSLISEIFKFFRKRNNFLLSVEYHSIGAYKLGDHMVKYKLVPIAVPVRSQEKRIDVAIADHMRNHSYELELMVQYCYDLKNQPVNQLNKMWKNSDFVPVGKIRVVELIDKDNKSIEAMSFNPFDSIKGLKPVGKIQRLRDEAYKVSLKTRNNI